MWAYDVVLDVYPDVIASGVLLIAEQLETRMKNARSLSANMDWKGRRCTRSRTTPNKVFDLTKHSVLNWSNGDLSSMPRKIRIAVVTSFAQSSANLIRLAGLCLATSFRNTW